MARYRKAWVAVGGGVVQLLAALATADEAGLLPQSWRPWVTAAIAAATAAGVYRVPNAHDDRDGRHEAPGGAW